MVTIEQLTPRGLIVVAVVIFSLLIASSASTNQQDPPGRNSPVASSRDRDAGGRTSSTLPSDDVTLFNRLAPVRAIPVLKRLSTSGQESTAVQALYALALHPRDEVHAFLKEMVLSNDRTRAKTAIATLGRRAQQRDLEVLMGLVQRDGCEYWRKHAALDALAEHNTPRVTAILLDELDVDWGPDGYDGGSYDISCYALAERRLTRQQKSHIRKMLRRYAEHIPVHGTNAHLGAVLLLTAVGGEGSVEWMLRFANSKNGGLRQAVWLRLDSWELGRIPQDVQRAALSEPHPGLRVLALRMFSPRNGTLPEAIRRELMQKAQRAISDATTDETVALQFLKVIAPRHTPEMQKLLVSGCNRQWSEYGLQEYLRLSLHLNAVPEQLTAAFTRHVEKGGVVGLAAVRALVGLDAHDVADDLARRMIEHGNAAQHVWGAAVSPELAMTEAVRQEAAGPEARASRKRAVTEGLCYALTGARRARAGQLLQEMLASDDQETREQALMACAIGRAALPKSAVRNLLSDGAVAYDIGLAALALLGMQTAPSVSHDLAPHQRRLIAFGILLRRGPMGPEKARALLQDVDPLIRKQAQRVLVAESAGNVAREASKHSSKALREEILFELGSRADTWHRWLETVEARISTR